APASCLIKGINGYQPTKHQLWPEPARYTLARHRMHANDQNRRLRELNQALHDTGCLAVRTRVYEFSQSLKIFHSNYADLEAAIHKHAANRDLFDYYDPRTQATTNEHLFEIIRHLHNAVAAAISLVDHTRVFYNRFYNDSKQI